MTRGMTAAALICLSFLNLGLGLYPGISGTVVDDITGKPIKGAVVLAQWNKKHGIPGLSYGDLYKFVETVTDEGGKFSVSGVLDPFVEPPGLVIYKRGYFAWQSDYIVQEAKVREDFKWRSGTIYRMERFVRGFSHQRHLGSFTSFFDFGVDSKMSKELKIERYLESKENKLYTKKMRDLNDSWKKLDAEAQGKLWRRLWNETLKELYHSKEMSILEERYYQKGELKSGNENKKRIIVIQTPVKINKSTLLKPPTAP
ncbi:carboxypeptidase-like regulatory domain-containing protein [Thermodesulfobacteriota bacterium]